MLADLPATRDFASSSASSFNAEPVAPMAQGSAPRGRHSMHGRATGDQLWVTPYVTRCTRLAAGPERGCLRARATLTATQARHVPRRHPPAGTLLPVPFSRPLRP